MRHDLIITREIAHLPPRPDDAHKGDAGRVMVIGGCCNEDVAMVGAPALVAAAVMRAGAGLVQTMVPAEIRAAVLSIVPVATARSLSPSPAHILRGLDEFQADAVALGPGLGNSLSSRVIGEVLAGFGGPCVVDADGLNQLAHLGKFDVPQPHRLVFTPHPGEAKRLLAARGDDREITPAPESRRDAALALVGQYQCTVVLKGRHTIVTNGDRLYINETGNSGLATAGTGDVLTGVIAGLIAQKVNPFEAAILGVYLHGLAADYAAEELGRRSLIATDLLDYLPEAFCEHEMVGIE